jgi:hypothetical protein
MFHRVPATLTRVVSGRSRPIRAGFPTGTHRHRSFDGAPSRGCVHYVKDDIASA